MPSLSFRDGTCISRLIDLHTAAHFFEVAPVQALTSRILSGAVTQLVRQHLLIVTEGPSGPARFEQRNIPGLLEQTTLAVPSAAPIVPSNDGMWFFAAILLRHVDRDDQFSQQLLRLSSIGAFSSAWVRVTNAPPASLDGFKTMFCDFCLRHCGEPWSPARKPCVPHE